ncbi:MAG: hypothetical protein DIU69_10560 [Bacillota bacterium]|nr:MAG: hypothetical protein DIU69_10560 [Bacillota bacterium]
MERERFLERVRRALGRGGVHGAAKRTRGVTGLGRADHPGDDPAAWPERFARELAAVKGSCEILSDPEAGAGPAAGAVAAACVRYARTHQLRRVVAWDPTALATSPHGKDPDDTGQTLGGVLVALQEEGCEVTPWRGEDAASLRRAAAAAELGIVVAHSAIAASGTVAVVHGPGRGRAVSLLPEHLLVLVPRDVLVPTLPDALARLAARFGAADPAAAPQNISLITGPSKSSDIELHPVVGVHGPRFVHAVVY